uniref:BAR/IMD domain containing adaptor protein 2 like 1a n=1 Tax=Salarias fasciatus TaxID=181472 RepID=A0A672GKF2_SALFA
EEREGDEVHCLCSLLQNVMEQFNPGLRNLVILGKNYEKSVTAMILSGKAYFDAVSKIGENAIVSPVSRELGESPAGPASVRLSFKRFQREIITELEKKTEMDVKYMNATFKRYQSEHKMKQDSLDRSQLDLKKLRRKSQGKNSSKYEIRENEYLETISCRQMDMQKFIADGCKEALLEEKRRFCFLADKHCMFSYQTSNFHEKAKEVLSLRLPGWQEKCSDVSQVPDTVATMIEKLSTPEQSPQVQHYNRNNVGSVVPPPAPPLKAQTSPLANMFNPEISLSRSTSQSSGLNMSRRSRVRTIFPHTAGNNSTLLSFDHGDIITLLLQEEKDGWLYGELERTQHGESNRRSNCGVCVCVCVCVGSNLSTPVRSLSAVSLPEQQELEQEDEDGPVLLPPPDYSDHSPSGPAVHCAPSPSPSPSPQNTVSVRRGSRFGRGGNPFATVKLRPTVTNDRSAPLI